LIDVNAMKIDIDLKVCLQSGQCCYLFPDFVRLGDDGFPQVLEQVAQLNNVERAEELVDTCPAMAIKVVQID
jgi:ferredoxin